MLNSLSYRKIILQQFLIYYQSRDKEKTIEDPGIVRKKQKKILSRKLNAQYVRL